MGNGTGTTGGLTGVSAALLLAGCAIGQTPTQLRIHDSAQICQRRFPEVVRYEVDQYRRIQYWVTEQMRQSDREAFVQCVREELAKR